jgi:hypothetical protein
MASVFRSAIASGGDILAKVTILYWQDIPSLVEARDGTNVQKQQLSARFQELIDMIAMRKKLVGSDAYLEQWRRGKPEERAGEVKAVAAAVAGEIEDRFEQIRSAAIAELGAS